MHQRLKRLVAVKVIADHRLPDPQAVTRFYREMEAVGRLSHPNIVQAHDAGEADGHHFLAMEFVAGRNLSQLVRSLGPLAVADACEIIRQACLGLDHAHRHELVHRDVKPSNLMLAPDGTVKLLDLGLARLMDNAVTDGETTVSQQFLGSPDFMAPEQARDPRLVDVRTDLYSVGCTLYFLLTGKPPFDGPQYDTRGKKVLGHAQSQPKPILSIRPDLPAGLSQYIARLMAKKPDARPRSAAEVAQVIAPLAAGADLPRLIRTLPEPQPGEESVLEAGSLDAAVSPARRSLPRSSPYFKPARIANGLIAVVTMALAWTYWPRQPASSVPVTSRTHLEGAPAKNPTHVENAAPTATSRLFFKGDPAGAVLRVSGGPDGPMLLDMDKQQSVWLPPGNYQIKIERETKAHIVFPDQVKLEPGESQVVVVGPAVPLPVFPPSPLSMPSSTPVSNSADKASQRDAASSSPPEPPSAPTPPGPPPAAPSLR